MDHPHEHAHEHAHSHAHSHHDKHKPILPREGTRNVLITAALPYVNNSPHLGNLIGAVLSADVFARYCRLRGFTTIYMGGTDEYGTATETKAKAAGKTPKEICDEYHAIHTQVYEWFGISFDYWGRTSTPKQTEIVQRLFLDLHRNGYIEEDSLDQLYCERCAMFLADRYVEGTCPDCKKPGARGDQCDWCGKLIDAVTLIDPRCTTCKAQPVQRSSRHLFLDLGKLADRLKTWTAASGGAWSQNARNITKGLLDKGLERRCITRDLKWGVPVPLPGWEDKVFYVWFDACIGYISITANYTPDWEQWWLQPANHVELVQFMGKDNVPFHTLVFPATLLGSHRPWTMLNNISTTEYLTYEGGKFSKSRGLGVFGPDVLKEGLEPHVWRYFLLASRPETKDADFQWTDLVAKTNTELVANPGNFVFRCVSLVKTRFGGAVPALGPLDEGTQKFVAEVAELVGTYVREMDKLELREALRIAMVASARANKFMTEKAPWEMANKDAAAAGTVMHVLLQAVSLVASLLSPFIPTFSAELCRQLAVALQPIPATGFPFNLAPGHAIGDNIVAIVKQIEGETRIEEWWERYGSTHLNSITIEMKVGVVQKVVPEGESYICTVDVGERELRTIVARLQKVYRADELQGSKVVVLANLKPRKLCNVQSQGMLLGARVGDAYGLLRIVDDAQLPCPPGAIVTPVGWSCKPGQPMKAEDFKAAKLYTHDDATLWWNSVKKKPDVKKQPKVNPKAAGKNKAAAKVADDAPAEVEVPQQLFAFGPNNTQYKIQAERVQGRGNVE